jgi:hypothetical protein
VKTEGQIIGAIKGKMTDESVARELRDLQTRLNELRSETLQLSKHDQHRRALIRAEKQYISNRIQSFMGQRIG